MFEPWTKAQALARFGDMQSDWLEREYTPSSAINGNYQPYITAYAQRSAAVRDALTSSSQLGVRYGKRPRNIIDVFPAPTSSGQPSPTVVFFHGGYWQESSLRDVSFPAAALNAEGITYISVGYTLAPSLTLSEIVDEARCAVAFIVANAALMSVDVTRLIIGGHSAGAHLAVLSGAELDGRATPMPGFALLSGIYELLPLLSTSINRALALQETELDLLSPLRGVCSGSPLATTPLVLPTPSELPQASASGRTASPPTKRQALVAWGAQDTDEFAWQSQMFSAALRFDNERNEQANNQRDRDASPSNSITSFCVADRNHFDLMFDLADRSSEVFQALCSQLRLSKTLRTGTDNAGAAPG